jgi:tetratricopeptide (TPR) repeat protein
MNATRQAGAMALLCCALPILAPHAAEPDESWSAERYRECTALAETAPEAALEHATAWVKENKSVAARHCLALALVAVGETDAAAEGLQILAKSMAAKNPDVAASLYAQSGNASILSEDPERAIAAFDSALALKAPEALQLEARVDRARAEAMAGDIWAAIDDLNQVLDAAPERDDCWTFRAAAYRRVEAYDLARDDADRALQINPDNVEAMVERGAARLLLGELDSARDDFAAAIDMSPESPSAEIAREYLETLKSIDNG